MSLDIFTITMSGLTILGTVLLISGLSCIIHGKKTKREGFLVIGGSMVFVGFSNLLGVIVFLPEAVGVNMLFTLRSIVVSLVGIGVLFFGAKFLYDALCGVKYLQIITGRAKKGV